jgi:hypothetical protein
MIRAINAEGATAAERRAYRAMLSENLIRQPGQAKAFEAHACVLADGGL